MSLPNIKKKKIAVYGTFSVLALILFVIQYNAAWQPEPGKPAVMIMVPFVMIAGILFKDWAGAFYGLVVGSAMDIVTPGTICFNAIMLMLLGWFSGFLIHRLMINNWISSVLIIFLNTTIYGLMKWLIFVVLATDGEPALYMTHITLPTVLLSASVGIILYFLLRTLARYLVKHIGRG